MKEQKRKSSDTLVLSVGSIPENELTLGAGAVLTPATSGAIVDEYFETTVPGIFAAGNVLHVHDLVDFVSLEAEAMARESSATWKEAAMRLSLTLKRAVMWDTRFLKSLQEKKM